MENKRILIVGAGASGMMASISAAACGADVTLLEHNEKPGKKLLLTGNGRCNLTNLDPALWNKYYSTDREALAACCRTLQRIFDVPETLDLFREMGLLTTDKHGYVYPLSDTAVSVLRVLEREMQLRGVRRKYAQHITKIEHDAADGLWNIYTDGYCYRGERVILCCGSRAYASTGSDGSGYVLAGKLGHTIIRPVPSLAGLLCGSKELQGCAGSRCQARVSVRNVMTGESVSDIGQVQFGRDGISGIVVFQLSGTAAQWMERGEEVVASLDFLPMWTVQEAEQFLSGQIGKLALSGASGSFENELKGILQGILPEKIAGLVAGSVAGKKDRPVSLRSTGTGNALRRKSGDDASLPSARTASLVAAGLKAFEIPVSGVRGFEQAQVCRGGVSLTEIDPATFESRKRPGLYFAGEILDADGPCGGYNLQWAWSSGFVAGRSAAGGM